MKKKLGILAAILLCCVCLPAGADLITIEISGQVTSVSDQFNHFGNNIHIGDTITGTYTYDSTGIDSNPLTGINLTVSGFDFKTDPFSVDFTLEVANNYIGADYYTVSSYSNLPLSDGTPVQFIVWWLYDPTGTALSSDAMPLTAPDLSRWNYSDLHISHDRDFGIGATVTSAVLVPEPVTLLLLAFGITACKLRKP